MRILVIYYSLTGNTRKVGDLLAAKLSGEAAEIRCEAYRGPFGGIRQAWDIFGARKPSVQFDVAPEQYDMIVAGGPVWAGRPAPPLRTFVSELRHPGGLALFLTCNGTSKNFSGEKALAEIAAAASGVPLATGLFKEAAIATAEIDALAADFAREILAAMPSGERSTG